MPFSLLDSPVTVTLITIIASALTGIITWLFGRRRSEIEIANIATETYSTMVADLRNDILDLRSIQDEQEKKIKRRDDKVERLLVYVEKLEDLLIQNNVIKRIDLEAIKAEIGV